MTEITTEKLKEIASIKGFGSATQYIRNNVDPLWGMGNEFKKYKIKVQQLVTTKTIETAYVEVVAGSEEAARYEVKKMWDLDDDFDWLEEPCSEETSYSDFEIMEMEPIQ
ncbi:MAG: hypothetical protein AB7U85_04795 [Alphaproteobacteria bacterium]